MPEKTSVSFDRFDICEAWYLFAVLYQGPNSLILKRLGVPSFRKLQLRGLRGRSLRSETDLTENSRTIFDTLVRLYVCVP